MSMACNVHQCIIAFPSNTQIPLFLHGIFTLYETFLRTRFITASVLPRIKKMGRLTGLKHIFIIVAIIVFTAECFNFGSSSNVPEMQTCCSQELCVFLFDRLEEQSLRLHNIEDALLRTLSIFTTYKEFPTAIAALKSDTLINSLLIPGDDDPEESIVSRMQQMPDVLETPIHGKIQYIGFMLSRSY